MDNRSMNLVPVSVVIITKNEERNIETCISSVSGWANEVIIVDDESTDKTIEIAKKLGAKVFERKMDIEGRHRNWAYSQAKNTWVLSLDADEQASSELSKEIASAIQDNTQFAAFSIPLRNYIGKYWVKHGGWYPAGKVRLFRKDKFKYEEVKVHPRVFIEGKCGHLTKDIIHHGYPDISHFLDSLNRQTTWEAEKWYGQEKPMTLGRFLWRTYDRFMRSYFGKKGWKDGFIGFVIAYYAGLYQWMSYLKYREIILRKEGKI